jgi:hypothetical protein
MVAVTQLSQAPKQGYRMESLEGVPYAAGVSDGGTMLYFNNHGMPTGKLKFFNPIATQDFYYDVENPPLLAFSGESQTESNYTDGSGALFSMYLSRAEEEDKKVAERWKGDADGILVFVRCFAIIEYPAGPYIDDFLS